MIKTKFSPIVKAVRFRYAALFVIMLVVVYLLVIHPWMGNWGSTAAEQQMVLPGDKFLQQGDGHLTKAITINASPEVIWQWLVQVGQDRAGFYTYTWLENLVGADIHNVNEIRPEWQSLAVGDAWRLVPADYLWGVGKEAASKVLISQPGYALVLEMWGAHVIIPVDENTSRLIVRGEAGQDNLMTTMLIDPLVFTLERRMLLGLKARAEGRPDSPAALMAIAYLGWVAAGIGVVFLFIIDPRRRFWLALPILAALPALLMSGDLQAALAAFLAAGITLLGVLMFGRSWWGLLLIVGSIVMLTLLLAPEAYTAIGLAFFLLLLAALGVWFAGRSKTTEAAITGSAVSWRWG